VSRLDLIGRTGLEYALGRVHHGENQLTGHLVRMADRHRADHEVHHVALDLSGWSRQHLARVADAAENYQISLSREPHEPGPVRHAIDSVLAKSPAKVAGLALLEDLRDLYLIGSETSLAWEMLAQHAQARRESDLLEVTTACHPQTLRQIRWANTMIKTLSPQILASLDS
jgi:hypothetical protein